MKKLTASTTIAVKSTCASQFSDLLAQGIARINISAVQPAIEPIHALLRGAVCERLRLHRAPGHFLNVIIPDGRRRS